jgi:DNA-binding NarL/FixJ family response regulator
MSPVARPRVLIADDQSRDAAEYASRLDPEFEIVGTALDEEALFAAISSLKPDVIILAVGLAGTNGLEIARRIRKALRTARIVYLATDIDSGIMPEGLLLGVSGLVPKVLAAEELALAIREVLKGERYISARISRETPTPDSATSISTMTHIELTDRQREVLKLLAEGRTMREIAYILTLTPRTVAFHKYKIMQRFHLRTNASLIQFAMQAGVITPRSE